MTAADHANTVRNALPSAGSIPAKDALDALQAQAEAATSAEWTYVPKSAYVTLKTAEAERATAVAAERKAAIRFRAERDAAESERDRLADALRRIVDALDHEGLGVVGSERLAIARAALAGDDT